MTMYVALFRLFIAELVSSEILHQIGTVITHRKAYVCGQVCSSVIFLIFAFWTSPLYQVSYISCLLDLWIPKGYLLVASLSGCGDMLSTEYFHSVFSNFVLTIYTAIHHLKVLVEVLVAVHLWGQHWQGCRIQLFCDNEAIVSILNTGRLHKIWLQSAHGEFEHAVHLPSQATILGIIFRVGIFLITTVLPCKMNVHCTSNARSSARFSFQVWWHSTFACWQRHFAV